MTSIKVVAIANEVLLQPGDYNQTPLLSEMMVSVLTQQDRDKIVIAIWKSSENAVSDLLQIILISAVNVRISNCRQELRLESKNHAL